MKTFSGFDRCAGRQSTQWVVFCLALVLGVAIFAAGCGKGKSAGPAAGANSQTALSEQVTNAAGEPVDLRQLNRQFIIYEMQNQRHFKTVEEFEAASNIQFPQPPPGKKYSINKRGYIDLVNQ